RSGSRRLRRLRRQVRVPHTARGPGGGVDRGDGPRRSRAGAASRLPRHGSRCPMTALVAVIAVNVVVSLFGFRALRDEGGRGADAYLFIPYQVARGENGPAML